MTALVFLAGLALGAGLAFTALLLLRARRDAERIALDAAWRRHHRRAP